MLNMHILFKDKTDIKLNDVKEINPCFRVHKISNDELVEFGTVIGSSVKNPYFLYVKYGERTVLVNTDIIDSINFLHSQPYSVEDIKNYLVDKYNFTEKFAYRIIQDCDICLDSEEWLLYEIEYNSHISLIEEHLHSNVWRN